MIEVSEGQIIIDVIAFSPLVGTFIGIYLTFYVATFVIRFLKLIPFL